MTFMLPLPSWYCFIVVFRFLVALFFHAGFCAACYGRLLQVLIIFVNEYSFNPELVPKILDLIAKSFYE